MGRKRGDGLRVCHNRQTWNGFNLVRGHIFGTVDGEKYVSGCYPAKPGYIIVYKYAETKDAIRWNAMAVSVKSELGKAILAVNKESPYYDVDFPAIEPCLKWTGHDSNTVNPSRGTWTGSQISTPRMTTMSQSKSGHYSPSPRPGKQGKTWIDEILQVESAQQNEPLAVVWKDDPVECVTVAAEKKSPENVMGHLINREIYEIYDTELEMLIADQKRWKETHKREWGRW